MKLKFLYLVVCIVFSNSISLAESTPAGGTPTVISPSGKPLTYYFQDGSAVPSLTNGLFVGMVGCSTCLMAYDRNGTQINAGVVYDTAAEAAAARKSAQVGNSGFSSVGGALVAGSPLDGPKLAQIMAASKPKTEAEQLAQAQKESKELEERLARVRSMMEDLKDLGLGSVCVSNGGGGCGYYMSRATCMNAEKRGYKVTFEKNPQYPASTPYEGTCAIFPKGVDGNNSSNLATDSETYKKNVFELAVVLSDAIEIGSKACSTKSAALTKWWTAVKAYDTDENGRNNALASRMKALKNHLTDEKEKETGSLQVNSVTLQQESLEASIESVNGKQGRIPNLESLILAALKAKDETVTDDILVRSSVDTFKTAMNNSIKTAKAACERMSKKASSSDEDDTTKNLKNSQGNDKKSEETLVKDPVPGCDEAQAKLNKGVALLDQYLVDMEAKKPSNILAMTLLYNGDYLQIRDIVNNLPKSNDSNFNWNAGLESQLNLFVQDAYFSKIAICPNSSGQNESIPTFPSIAIAGVDDSVHIKFRQSLKKAASDDYIEKVETAAKSFLQKFGIEENEETIKAYKAAWDKADLIIGMPYNRKEYFDFIIEKATAVLSTDQSSYNSLLANQQQLMNYQSSLQATLETTGGGKGATFSGVQDTSNVALVNKQAKNNVGKSAVNSQKFSAQSASLDESVTATGVAAISNSLSSQTSSSAPSKFESVNLLSGGGNLSLSSSSMAIANKLIKNISNNEKKVADLQLSSKGGFKKENTALGDKKAVSASTAAGNSANKAAPAFGESLKGVFEKFKSAPKSTTQSASSNIASYGENPDFPQKEMSAGNSKESIFGIKTNNTTSNQGQNTEGSSRVNSAAAQGQASAIVNKDKEILENSIMAKKFTRKSTYEASESDSLFERVTKAYIRSYEKVGE